MKRRKRKKDIGRNEERERRKEGRNEAKVKFG